MPLTWSLKQKERLCALHPDMSDSIINMKIFRKCGRKLEHAINCRCAEPCSKEDYINEMEHSITRTGIVVSPNENTCREEFVTDQIVEAHINPSLSSKMRPKLIDVLYTYKNSFASDNRLLGAITGHEVDVTLNIDKPYPPILRRPAYPESPRARYALEKHIQELIKVGLIRKVGNNEEVEVKTPVIIAWHNYKCRMVGDFRALNTYTVPDRYPICRIQGTFTQLSKAKYITSMDALKGFYYNISNPKPRNYLELSLTVVFMNIVECQLELEILHLIIKE
ncbi:hypothetical protein O181_031355 [Austropuccinia psidii MF-1]|uniref:Reverse transcriptase domain-containing protein n=1 Tax=Austropuccinia psidii MF-1 TaxID=1389203 RepID=A0A9Q3CXT7_9BASI|nr:hypothetical protein [Austropuccinia psidii MF-1]